MSNEKKLKPLLTESSQAERNKNLLAKSRLLSPEITSEIIPFHIDINGSSSLTNDELNSLELLQIDAARIATASLASLSTINELDHLGGGLDLIPALMLSLALTDYRTTEYTIEHAHTSIGYYSALSALGFLPKKEVIDGFRRGIEIPGHVSWVPGGTQLNGGRLGVMVPVAVGQALAKRATMGEQAWVLVHCGDAGWISGQALNGFNGADLHHAPVTFIMHRNGIQLSGSTKKIMDKDPRKIIESLGIDIIETPSLFDMKSLFNAYREAKQKAINGRPSLIYPTGYRSSNKDPVTLDKFGNIFGIEKETSDFARQHNVSMGTEIWIPGSLMSFRDLRPMLECLFLVNNLPGGVGHHDGHMKGRNLDEVLSNPMMELTTSQLAQLDKLNQKPKQKVVTKSRPESGSKNFEITQRMLDEVALPMLGKNVSARAGIEAGYEMIAKKYPQNMFVVSCDLDVSTKLLKACQHLDPKHRFEMSIEEQASALIANGLALNNTIPQLTVFSTFAAFFEGIAREGFELWRYTRNLNGVNEGLNVTFHMSHVGSCTGRDHFSGWSLDWITLAMGYLPYLHRFYAPADARSAFIAVRDLAEHYGGHIIGIPRDNLPILEKQDGSGPMWDVDSKWVAMELYLEFSNSKTAILAFGATAYIAVEAAEKLQKQGISADVYVIQGLPIPKEQLESIFSIYTDGIVTVEDGIIGTREIGLRGFASLISSSSYGFDIPLDHIGITDPQVAPSEGHMETWDHFCLTPDFIVKSVKQL